MEESPRARIVFLSSLIPGSADDEPENTLCSRTVTERVSFGIA